MHDAEEFGPFPNSRIISTVFSRAADLDRAAAVRFGCGILEPAAGLVVAHRCLAAQRPDWHESATSWAPDIRLPRAPAGNDAFTAAWEAVQRHMLSIDLEARRGLPPPRGSAVPHHEGLGAVVGRMAYLYTISYDGFVLDGPEGANRRQLASAYVDYENLVRALVAGRKRLPCLSYRPEW